MSIDYRELFTRFEGLGNGLKAELRRCASPSDVALLPAFYRLFSGVRGTPQLQRIAYFLPVVKQDSGAESLGTQLAKARISETRLFQMVRSSSPNDLIQLRRLLQQLDPSLDWSVFGSLLFYWGDQQKRRLLEDFFMHQTNNT